MDYAIATRKAMIAKAVPLMTAEEKVDAEISRLQAGNEAKRIRSINKLGNRWVLHPDYSAAKNPQHNPTFKSSIVLSMFLHYTGAVSSGRV